MYPDVSCDILCIKIRQDTSGYTRIHSDTLETREAERPFGRY